MRKVVVAISVLIGLVLIIAIVAWKLFIGFLEHPVSAGETVVSVRLPEGITYEELDALLFNKGLLAKEGWFAGYLDHFRKDYEISAGEYRLAGSMSPYEIADSIAKGNVVTYPITVPAGLSTLQLADVLFKDGVIKKDAFLATVQSASLAASLGIGSDTLDGYIFPDAYEFPRAMDPQDFVRQVVRRYRKQISPAILERAEELGLSEHELITLASLIEIEVRPEERPMFSAMYHARLVKGMPLESRSALALGLDKESSELDKADFKVEADYNTYLRPGLPKHPVANPSLKSIFLAANPPKSDVLYAAPLGDAKHQFCVDKRCFDEALARARGEKVRPPSPIRLPPPSVPPPPEELTP